MVCVVGRHERVYYIACGGPGLLVDCGSKATYAANVEMLEGEGVDVSSVKAILVTHEHFDHRGHRAGEGTAWLPGDLPRPGCLQIP